MKDIYLCGDGTYTEDPMGCRGAPKEVLSGRLRLALSKLLSGILRHFPDSYGVKVDYRGWARIDDVVEGLRRAGYRWVEKWHIEAIATLDPKGRFEIRGGLIRARYGHSIKVRVEPLGGKAPSTLFHGTVRSRLSSIMARGLLPMKRVKVHLTSSLEDALETAKRHGRDIVVLEIDVGCVESSGYRVQRASKTVYVTDYVPPECIKRVVEHSGEPR